MNTTTRKSHTGNTLKIHMKCSLRIKLIFSFLILKIN